MEFKVTKREIMVTIAITLILIGIGFLISSSIRNAIYESNEKYHKSLKIDGDINITVVLKQKHIIQLRNIGLGIM